MNEIIETAIEAVANSFFFFFFFFYLKSVRNFPQTTHRTRIRRYPRFTRNSGLSLRKHNRLIIRLTRTNRGRSSSLRDHVYIYIEFHHSTPVAEKRERDRRSGILRRPFLRSSPPTLRYRNLCYRNTRDGSFRFRFSCCDEETRLPVTLKIFSSDIKRR